MRIGRAKHNNLDRRRERVAQRRSLRREGWRGVQLWPWFRLDRLEPSKVRQIW